MKSTDRIALYESLLDTFLSRSKEKGYIVFEVQGTRDEYVQLQLHGGSIYGEVGSRQWTDPERALPASAVDGLGRLGFTGGGPETNYSRDGLPTSKVELAVLTDSLLRTAYGVDDDFSPVVREMNFNDVTLPRAEPFTRAMIEAHLRAKGAHFLRDEDGDFRVDLNCDGSDNPVATWFVAEGPGESTYRISATAPHRPVPPTRFEAVERCNLWNATHGWLSAIVAGDDDLWWIAVHHNVDLAPGIPRALFEGITDSTVGGILEFWTWIAAPAVDAPTASPVDEQADGPPHCRDH